MRDRLSPAKPSRNGMAASVEPILAPLYSPAARVLCWGWAAAKSAALEAAAEVEAGGAVTVKRSIGSAEVSYSDSELASDSAALSSPVECTKAARHDARHDLYLAGHV